MNENFLAQLKTWAPLITTAVALIGFFFTMSSDIQALETEDVRIKANMDAGGPLFLELIKNVERLNEKTDYLIKSVDELKAKQK